ncbi:ActS/PrrB/RegB family redox-sensitive histidine kinase [Rhizobium sp. TH2]|uniref:ActS/PrrB/RegB family redox-sensitive histidine kinase n=1 Tax=Rhizobium sp. TH2 TaxID=2775403 RepID=UPI0021582BD5|nr:ActS/PrrB/RegB family redox-sensitive histidine kinase [Rhizobium sp. TH2]UVC08532.1 ActS/PrrB/RegB family redox-sensitive histidine kinase [Rhizobium sp. TH2]
MVVELVREGPESRKLRLETLVRLRWLAVGGQTVTVLIVGVFLQFSMPIEICALLIAALAVVNAWLQFSYPATWRLEPSSALALLAFDLLQLTALLYVTGGISNPFAPLISVPVIISSASQPIRYSLALVVMAMLAITALVFSPFPLPWYPGSVVPFEPLLLAGMWFAIVSTTSFAAFYAYRVSHEANQLSEALTATELVLQREMHLSELDGLAAAAAHELGTPLATISLVAKEMSREIEPGHRLYDDVHLLISQAERCRDIMKRLTTLSADNEEHMKLLPLSSLIEEVTAPHREFGIAIEVIELSPRADEPMGRRNAGIMYGLGNLIENAVDYAKSRVTVTVVHDRGKVTIMIEDDGEGFAPDILQRIGDPYVTRRNPQAKAGGLGLGLFIAKTLLERSGAELSFENSPGARIKVEWKREFMDVSG